MNEEPKSIWKKSWTGWGWLRAWLILTVAIFVILVILSIIFQFIFGGPRHFSDLMLASGFYSLVIPTVAVGFLAFIGCFFSWRNFKRLLFGLACLATLVALAYAEEDWRGWHAWNKFKHEWEAKGEKFDFASVVPPPVPDDQNFALTPVVGSCYAAWLDKNGNRVKPYVTNVVDRLDFDLGDRTLKINDLGNWAKGTFSDLKLRQVFYRELGKTNLFPVPPQPQSPAADVLLALSRYDTTVEELRQASQLPQCRFPLNYRTENPAAILLPPLAAMKRTCLILQLRSLAELQNGQSDKALADVKLSLYLANSIRTEPFLISHLVRSAMLQITLQPIYESLAEHKWSDTQLAALDAELAKFDFLSDYGVAIRGERACNIGVIEYLRHAHNKFRTFASLSGQSEENNGSQINWTAVVLSFGPSGWFYQNELKLSQFYTKWYLPVADDQKQIVSLASVRAASRAADPEIRRRTPENLLEAWLLPALGHAVRGFARAQSSVDLARAATALERYWLAHGEYPESLDALAPQFMGKVPHDIIGGGPLHYRRTDDGQFVLYSVGWNERDDGGVVVFNKGSTQVVNRDEGDWVWRYPQK
jgi:hypothetical protein